MKVIKAEIVRSKEPIHLPQPWLAAWCEPDGKPVTSFEFACYKLYTDKGIVGIGPYSGASPTLALNVDPFHVGAFWEMHMSGRRAGTSGKGASGLEIALWDIIGKAAKLPLYKLLGAQKDRIPVYAATSRLLPGDKLADKVLSLMELGFKAVKLRLHRPDPRDDLAAVEAVRRAAGDDLLILVDCNQNNPSNKYCFWSRRTSLKMARALEQLGVYVIEEPRPRIDVEGLAEIATTVDMLVSGGEHSPTVFDFKQHVLQGAFDVLQPDVQLSGNIGITGIRQVAHFADYFGRQVIPHVMSGAHFPLCMAATLHAMATVNNCPLVEFPYDPPILVPETTQAVLREPFRVEADGCVLVPTGPGLGIELDSSKLIVDKGA
jgi:L-alanine-DL-glutamate epimerase-like enolase superfamily enzyme